MVRLREQLSATTHPVVHGPSGQPPSIDGNGNAFGLALGSPVGSTDVGFVLTTKEVSRQPCKVSDHAAAGTPVMRRLMRRTAPGRDGANGAQLSSLHGAARGLGHHRHKGQGTQHISRGRAPANGCGSVILSVGPERSAPHPSLCQLLLSGGCRPVMGRGDRQEVLATR